MYPKLWQFQSTRLSRASTIRGFFCILQIKFQSTRLSRASTKIVYFTPPLKSISIHKALASLDKPTFNGWLESNISIHKALASLDDAVETITGRRQYFNPQGSREPRPFTLSTVKMFLEFQSTRLSRASTGRMGTPKGNLGFQATRLSRAST